MLESGPSSVVSETNTYIPKIGGPGLVSEQSAAVFAQLSDIQFSTNSHSCFHYTSNCTMFKRRDWVHVHGQDGEGSSDEDSAGTCS